MRLTAPFISKLLSNDNTAFAAVTVVPGMETVGGEL